MTSSGGTSKHSQQCRVNHLHPGHISYNPLHFWPLPQISPHHVGYDESGEVQIGDLVVTSVVPKHHNSDVQLAVQLKIFPGPWPASGFFAHVSGRFAEMGS